MNDLNPCEIGRTIDRDIALQFVETLLDSTGDDSTYAITRAELGLNGVSFSQISIVQDTTKCRSALNAWKSDYASISPELASATSPIASGMLIKLSPNRFALATVFYNQYTFLTYTALDSNFTIIRRNF